MRPNEPKIYNDKGHMTFTAKRKIEEAQRKMLKKGVQPPGVKSPKGDDITWDSLNDLFAAMAQGVYDFSASLGENLRFVTNAGKATPVFINLINVGVQDCDTYAKRLVAIHERHKNLTGRIYKPEDYMLYQELGLEYNNFLTGFRHHSFQVSTEVTTHLSEVVTSQDVKQNLQNLVTDAVEQAQQASREEVVANETLRGETVSSIRVDDATFITEETPAAPESNPPQQETP